MNSKKKKKMDGPKKKEETEYTHACKCVRMMRERVRSSRKEWINFFFKKKAALQLIETGLFLVNHLKLV